MKKLLAMILSLAMILALAACGNNSTQGNNAPQDNTPQNNTQGDDANQGDDAPAALIKVGVINNDPNESGYRTANDRAMREMFTEANGYDATFYNNNDAAQQIATAQQMIQDEVDYLLLSPGSKSILQSMIIDPVGT